MQVPVGNWNVTWKGVQVTQTCMIKFGTHSIQKFPLCLVSKTFEFHQSILTFDILQNVLIYGSTHFFKFSFLFSPVSCLDDPPAGLKQLQNETMSWYKNYFLLLFGFVL